MFARNGALQCHESSPDESGLMNLFVFGLGYSARHFLARHRDDFARVAGTVRTHEKADALSGCAGIEAVPFDDRAAVEARLREADILLVSVPTEDDDPALRLYRDAIAAAPNLSRVVYLSTIGVYGDHGGAWIDESAAPKPVSKRNRARVISETEWLSLATPDRRVFVLRLAGIYGPGRNQIENLRDGTARRIVKDGQFFNRIHVEDISRAIAACLATENPGGIFNVTDDEPAPPQDVVTFAAGLLGVAPPPEIPFAEADFSPMARSFWGQNKRVSNRRLREILKVELACPTYREGLRSLI